MDYIIPLQLATTSCHPGIHPIGPSSIKECLGRIRDPFENLTFFISKLRSAWMECYEHSMCKVHSNYVPNYISGIRGKPDLF